MVLTYAGREQEKKVEKESMRKLDNAPKRKENNRHCKPIRRFEPFTSLNTPRSYILMQIQKEGYLIRAPPRMKTNPDKRDNRKYYNYHKDHGYNTDQCRQLEEDTEALIRKGYLRCYLDD